MKDQMLLLEGFISNLEIDLKESSLDKGLLRFKGKLQEAEIVNKNKRRYPYSVLDENVRRLQEVVKSRGLIGELDHPADSIIHFKEASHVITKLWWDGQILMGEGEILTTAHGRQMKALLECGIRLGMSSRGVGNGKMDDSGILVIGEGYKLITFDAVADPSTPAAYQEEIKSAKREYFIPQNISTKNDETRIHTLNKEAIIAALGGVIKETTNKFLARK